MLSITALNRFYYLRDFHDMRCKYERVLSVIHQQLKREPEVGDVFMSCQRNSVKYAYSVMTGDLTACMKKDSHRIIGS